jgi:biotin carboxyl carrier protein
MKYVTTINEKSYIIEINDDKRVIVDGVEYAVDFESVSGQPVYSLLINGRSFEAYVHQSEESADWQVLIRGDLFNALVEDEREKRLRAAAGALINSTDEFNLKAPMPGLIVTVPVAEGQEVQKGQILIVLESMKMQNELKTPRHGKVTRIRVKAGDNVDQNQVLVTVA